MYQTERGRRLTLYVRAETAPHRETAFRYARENNVGVFYWIDREQAYAIASADLSKEELLRAARWSTSSSIHSLRPSHARALIWCA
jgi:hypothetical protein